MSVSVSVSVCLCLCLCACVAFTVAKDRSKGRQNLWVGGSSFQRLANKTTSREGGGEEDSSNNSGGEDTVGRAEKKKGTKPSTLQEGDTSLHVCARC